MKKKILYFSIPLIFLSIGFYVLNHSHDGKNNTQKVAPVVLPVVIEQTPQQENNQTNSIDILSHAGGTVDKSDETISQENIKKKNYPITIQPFFSPKEDIRQVLIDCINKETIAISCAAYRLTDPLIAKALVDAHYKGVKLQFVIDKEGFSALYSKFLYFFALHIPVFIYPPVTMDIVDMQKREGLMHNKFMLFHSQELLITGSFNYTKSAQDINQENILVIHDPVTFLIYKDHFNYLTTISSQFEAKNVIKKKKRFKYKK